MAHFNAAANAKQEKSVPQALVSLCFIFPRLCSECFKKTWDLPINEQG